MKKQHIKEFVCEQYGKESVAIVPIIEVNMFGTNWDIEYTDNVLAEEYAVTFREHTTRAAITLWFTSPMKRKEFLNTVNSRDRINQTTTGMHFDHLDGPEKKSNRIKDIMRDVFGIRQ